MSASSLPDWFVELTAEKFVHTIPEIPQLLRAAPTADDFVVRYELTSNRYSCFVTATLKKDNFSERVQLTIPFQTDQEIAHYCSCRTPPYCASSTRVLLDLGASHELRKQLSLSAGRIVTSAVTPEERERFSKQLSSTLAIEAWTRPIPTAGPLEIFLSPKSVEVPHTALRPGAAIDKKRYENQLEIRFRTARDRELLQGTELLNTVDPTLRAVLESCETLSRSRKGYVASGVLASALLEAIASYRVYFDEKKPKTVRFVSTPITLSTQLDGGLLSAHWHGPHGRLNTHGDELYFHGLRSFLWVPSEGSFYRVDGSPAPELVRSLLRTPLTLPEGNRPQIYEQLHKNLHHRGIPLPSPTDFGVKQLAPPTFVVRLEGALLDPMVRIEAHYGPIQVQLPPRSNNDPPAYLRDRVAEENAERLLSEAGLSWDLPRECWSCPQDEAPGFWTRKLPALRSQPTDPPLQFMADERLLRARDAGTVRVSLRATSGINWFEVRPSFELGGEKTEFQTLLDALRTGRRWITLESGAIAKISKEVELLVYELAASEATPQRDFKLAKHQWGTLERWISLAEEQAELDLQLEQFRQRIRALRVAPRPEIPEHCTAVLRAYQKQGLAWLQFLQELQLNGILADDMGLGKTVTTLTLLQWAKESQGQGTSLVVCPTSVLMTWQREAERFTPKLRILVHHGEKRPQASEFQHYDVVLTTYALLRKEVGEFATRDFRYVVLDEAQNIKNHATSTHKAVKQLRSRFRLALSGTPVENRLAELWSLMDFLNPGMLGTIREFEHKFGIPIANEPHGPTAERLQAMLRPFILRRTKSQVLEELPPKEEIDRVCELSSKQQKLYDTLATELRRSVEQAIQQKGVAAAGINVLTALLRLRQMACDPQLIDPTLPGILSAKREAFLELVEELQESGRRALVFSQFVELLSLWRKELDERGITYEYLDGSTTDRETPVDRFQNGNATLFLLSLKAGGTGLNLTAADTVIHCDPWWNPAVEDQATDRAHRLGQTQSVTVFRLIAGGTVEEKIGILKAKKRTIAEAVLTGDAGALKGLTAEQVRELLANIAE